MKKTVLQIKSNVIWEIEKIKEDSGIISNGFLKDGSEIMIQNLDAGNSIELMRVAMQGKKGSGFPLIIKVVFGVMSLIFSIIFIIFLISLFSGKKEEVKDQNIVFSQTPIIQDQTIQDQTIQDQTIQDQTIQEIEKQKIFFEIESIKMEKDFIIKTLENEKTILQNEYNSLYKLFEQEKQKTAILSQENEILKTKTKELSSDQKKYIEVGEKIKNICEKTKTKDCLELFF